jgi:hypothetical protein
MSSDHNDICLQSGFSANDDAETNALDGWIDHNLLTGVREDLSTNYSLELDFQEIEDMMSEEGITFGYEGDYSVADLIFDSLQEDV